MNYIDTPISKKIKKEVIAFEVEEQATLLQYINTHTIITDTKSAYDDTTVENLIRTAFLIGARYGELGGLDYTKHIDWELERVIIERTLTKNKERKIVMGAIESGMSLLTISKLVGTSVRELEKKRMLMY